VGKGKKKGLNPLDIWYQTQDASMVIAAELENLPLLETAEGQPRRQLLTGGDRFTKSSFNIAQLAEAIQAPVEKGGIRMQNRRWHFRLHYNCFIGSDMTTWLMDNFRDIDTREEAVEFGNMLMVKDEDAKVDQKEKDKDQGIFVHVEKRHPFRDGQYFYQVVGEYAKPRPSGGWPFGPKRRDVSVPNTPMSEFPPKESPKPERTRSSSNTENSKEGHGQPGSATPTNTSTGRRQRVCLSNMMRYDVDPRRRSYRPERINLHYDRIHNPDNCYHIRLEWMTVTAKLIEDAIASWAVTAERYGLHLVEVPINEASTIAVRHPFRAPFTIKLALPPPSTQPPTDFEATSLVPVSVPQIHYYQKAILKKHNFVLDTEAASNFPSNVEVTYSWGKPDYKFTQYIHRSGMVLAQITDEGDFILGSNKMFNNRVPAMRNDPGRLAKASAQDRDRQHEQVLNAQDRTPVSSPMVRASVMSPALRPSPPSRPNLTSSVSTIGGPGTGGMDKRTPDAIKDELETLCHDPEALRRFYAEVWDRAASASVPATPPVRLDNAGAGQDSDIPAFGLGPGLTWNSTPFHSMQQAMSLSGTSMSGSIREGLSTATSTASFRDVSREGFGSLRMPFRRGSNHESDSGSVIGPGQSPRVGPVGSPLVRSTNAAVSPEEGRGK
jgi:hypothetical protein